MAGVTAGVAHAPADRPMRAAPPDLAQRYHAVRQSTLALCDGLTAEDCQVQSMADASPVKWHLAHANWFFETFVLAESEAARAPCDPAFTALFNSYYHSIGPQHPRPQRGLLSRPSLAQVLAWRERVDDEIGELLLRAPGAQVEQRIELGLQHEQQHQELILTDVKHALWCNPLRPALRPAPARTRTAAPAPPAPGWMSISGPVAWIGSDSGHGFCFDNERPRHLAAVQPAALATHLVTNGEFGEFVRDGGYAHPLLWLADGWATVQADGWQRPLYWLDDLEREFTLHGVREIDPGAPACHLSYYEADAYARWAGCRLPREEEWECAAEGQPVDGQFVESGTLHPRRLPAGALGFFGSVWQWTMSAYQPYPGFQPEAGALGEYNGKFMCNQLVLRGGSCASSVTHLRPTYRNFFAPHARWQFSGLRLAREAA